MPIPGSNFKYGFFADMEFDQRKKLDHVLHAITDLTNSVRIFGVYQKGKMQKG
jgi:prephenate dehydratase